MPPRNDDDLFLYPGNVRSGAFDSEPEETGENFGGPGGDGAPGRIRIEAPAGSALVAGGTNENITSGTFIEAGVPSQARSLVTRLGFGPASTVSTFDTTLGSGRIIVDTFRQSEGARAVVLWSSADESIDSHARSGPISQGVVDPSGLKGEFVQFEVDFTSDAQRQSVRAIQAIEMPYTVEGSIMVCCGVCSFGVVGPKTAMELGQKIF